MNDGVASFKKNTALVAIIIIDLLFLVWSCEGESSKVANQLNGKNKKEIAITQNTQNDLS